MLNAITLIGRIGRDPKISIMGDNKSIWFTMATSIKYKKDGETQTKTTWHNVKSYAPNVVDFVSKYVQIGDIVCVQGSMEYSEYETEDKQKKIFPFVLMKPAGGITIISRGKSTAETEMDKNNKDAKGNDSLSSDNDLTRNNQLASDSEIPF